VREGKRDGEGNGDNDMDREKGDVLLPAAGQVTHPGFPLFLGGIFAGNCFDAMSTGRLGPPPRSTAHSPLRASAAGDDAPPPGEGMQASVAAERRIHRDDEAPRGMAPRTKGKRGA